MKKQKTYTFDTSAPIGDPSAERFIIAGGVVSISIGGKDLEQIRPGVFRVPPDEAAVLDENYRLNQQTTRPKIETFYDHDLGHFNSTKEDLSDLGEPYLSAAKRHRERKQPQ